MRNGARLSDRLSFLPVFKLNRKIPVLRMYSYTSSKIKIKQTFKARKGKGQRKPQKIIDSYFLENLSTNEKPKINRMEL